jgi:hypothetical protein
MIRVSFDNLVAGVGVVITASSQDTAYPATNLTSPERPFLPAKTTATGEQWWVIDFGGAVTIGQLHLVRANFTGVTVQGNGTDVWTAPAFSTGLTVQRNRFTGRYQWAGVLAGFTYRYMRILVPSQTPADGAAAYLLGGVWAGASARLPKDVLWDVAYEVVEPRKDLQPSDGGWRQRLVEGDPLLRLTVNRLAKTVRKAPGLADGLAAWLDVDRQAREAGPFALFLNAGDDSQGYVVQTVNPPTWQMQRLRRAGSQWSVEEALR